ncbi:molybdate-binding protein [Pseudonocardia asaccharolytica DSM 44247 = NBRC 16224]|uniref:Molybdate-binding protein ModA n=2 Tax=Pseudonocardia asaccharolytica TaxID=54010 RepID=A0A511CWU2_9PSEU|nr:molybdate-binding protein [Pseudonocardia asaccharolytica DSM 44247 = NBRC 16224]
MLGAVIAGLGLVLAACGGGSAGSDAAEGSGASDQTLTVFAAASLTETFTELGKRFETDHPGVTVRFNFAGSSNLAQQIVSGAPADVFASANTKQMGVVADKAMIVGEPQVFVTNRLQIAVAPGNPKGVASFADLAEPETTLVVCAPQVPCGSATQKVEQATGVDLKPVSEEPDVRSVLGKVISGNADAGLVYVTDVAAEKGKVDGVNFPEAEKAINDYPIGVVTSSKNQELATQFVELVRGEVGAKVLETAGFGTPAGS